MPAASGPETWSDASKVSVGSSGATWASSRRARARSKGSGPASRAAHAPGGSQPACGAAHRPSAGLEEPGIEGERHGLPHGLAAGESPVGAEREESDPPGRRRRRPGGPAPPTPGARRPARHGAGPPGPSPAERGRVVRHRVERQPGTLRGLPSPARRRLQHEPVGGELDGPVGPGPAPRAAGRAGRRPPGPDAPGARAAGRTAGRARPGPRRPRPAAPPARAASRHGTAEPRSARSPAARRRRRARRGPRRPRRARAACRRGAWTFGRSRKVQTSPSRETIHAVARAGSMSPRSPNATSPS